MGIFGGPGSTQGNFFIPRVFPPPFFCALVFPLGIVTRLGPCPPELALHYIIPVVMHNHTLTLCIMLTFIVGTAMGAPKSYAISELCIIMSCIMSKCTVVASAGDACCFEGLGCW